MTEGGQGRKLEAGIEAENLAEAVTYSPGSQSLSISQRGGSAHSVLGPPTSTINQENASQACPQVSLAGGFSQQKFLLPK